MTYPAAACRGRQQPRPPAAMRSPAPADAAADDEPETPDALAPSNTKLPDDLTATSAAGDRANPEGE